MNKEEQRIKIAEACGLFKIAPLKRTNRKGKDDPFGVCLWYCDSDHGGVKEYAKIPNYPEDLNAMHIAEQSLCSIQHWIHFEKYLAELGTKFIWHATAAQRAEAFLRTLDLWEE